MAKDKRAAFMAYVALKEAENYARRGRRFKGLEVEALRNQWIAAFERFTANFEDNEARLMQHDLRAELLLRNHEAPYERVSEALDKVGHAVSVRLKVLQQEYPADIPS